MLKRCPPHAFPWYEGSTLCLLPSCMLHWVPLFLCSLTGAEAFLAPTASIYSDQGVQDLGSRVLGWTSGQTGHRCSRELVTLHCTLLVWIRGAYQSPQLYLKFPRYLRGLRSPFHPLGPLTSGALNSALFLFIYFFFQNSPELFREAVQKGLTSFKVSSPEWTLLQYMEDLLLAIADPPTCLWDSVYLLHLLQALTCQMEDYLCYKLSWGNRTHIMSRKESILQTPTPSPHQKCEVNL